jgi:CBS domain-containing protein
MPQIREVMTSNPTACEPSTGLVDVARKMRDEDTGAIPIVEGGRLVGMITDRDIVIRAIAEGRDPQSTTVGELASKNVVAVEPDDDLERALELMGERQVRRLPVVEDDRLVGIVAQADIARHGSDTKTGQVVEEISQ